MKNSISTAYLEKIKLRVDNTEKRVLTDEIYTQELDAAQNFLT
jgi:hypothetical protein